VASIAFGTGCREYGVSRSNKVHTPLTMEKMQWLLDELGRHAFDERHTAGRLSCASASTKSNATSAESDRMLHQIWLRAARSCGFRQW